MKSVKVNSHPQEAIKWQEMDRSPGGTRRNGYNATRTRSRRSNPSLRGEDKRIKELEDENNLVKISSSLEVLESKGKYDVDDCNAAIELWQTVVDSSFGSSSCLKGIFVRLIKNLARTILNGKWAEVEASSKEKLKGNISLIASSLDKKQMSAEERSCQAMCRLMDTTIWQEEYLNKVLKEPIDIRSVNALWKAEGWILIESRIEALYRLPNLNPLAKLAEACVLKGAKLYFEVDDETALDTSNPYDMTPEKLYQVAAVFAITLSRLQKDDAESLSRLDPYLLQPRLSNELLARLCDAGNPHRILPGWKHWKRDKEVALALCQRRLEIARDVVDSVEIHDWFTMYLKLNYLTRKKDSTDHCDIEALTRDLSHLTFTPGSESAQDKLLELSIPENVKTFIPPSSVRSELIFIYADAIMKLLGKIPCTLNKVVDLYVSELAENCSTLYNIRANGDKGETNIFSNMLSRGFESLAKHLEFAPQICFEVLLTSFSLNPSQGLLDRIVGMVESSTGTKVDVSLKITPSQNSTVGFAPDVFVDFVNVVQSARVARLTCFRDNWDKFKALCVKHLETRGEDIKTVDDLDLAKPTDFSLYVGMKPAYDDNDTGYEAGYCPEELEELEENPLLPQKKPKKIREPAFRMRMLLEDSKSSKKSNVVKPRNDASAHVVRLVKKLKMKPGPKPKLHIARSKPSSRSSTGRAKDGVPKRGRPPRDVKCKINGNASLSKDEEDEADHLKPAKRRVGRKPTAARLVPVRNRPSGRVRTQFPPSEYFRQWQNKITVVPRIPIPFPTIGNGKEYMENERVLLETPYIRSQTLYATVQDYRFVHNNWDKAISISRWCTSASQASSEYSKVCDSFQNALAPGASQLSIDWQAYLTNTAQDESTSFNATISFSNSIIPSSLTISELTEESTHNTTPPCDSIIPGDMTMSEFSKKSTFNATTPPSDSIIPSTLTISEMAEESTDNATNSTSDSTIPSELTLSNVTEESPFSATTPPIDPISPSNLTLSEFTEEPNTATPPSDPIIPSHLTLPEFAEESTNNATTLPSDPIVPDRLILSELTGELVELRNGSVSEIDDQDLVFSDFSDDEDQVEDEVSEDSKYSTEDEASAEDSTHEKLEVLSEVTGEVVVIQDLNAVIVFLSESLGEFLEILPPGAPEEDLVPADSSAFEGLSDSSSTLLSPPIQPTDHVAEESSSEEESEAEMIDEIEISENNKSDQDEDEPIEYLGTFPSTSKSIKLPKVKPIVKLPKALKVSLKRLTVEEIAKYDRCPVPVPVRDPSPLPNPDPPTSPPPLKLQERRKSCPAVQSPSEKSSRCNSAETRRSSRSRRTQKIEAETEEMNKDSKIEIPPAVDKIEAPQQAISIVPPAILPVTTTVRRGRGRPPKRRQESSSEAILENIIENTSFVRKILVQAVDPPKCTLPTISDSEERTSAKRMKVSEVKPKSSKVKKRKTSRTSLPKRCKKEKVAKLSRKVPPLTIQRQRSGSKPSNKVPLDPEFDELSEDFDDENDEDTPSSMEKEDDPEFLPDTEDEVDNFVDDSDYECDQGKYEFPRRIERLDSSENLNLKLLQEYETPGSPMVWKRIIPDYVEPDIIDDVEDSETDPLALDLGEPPVIDLISSDEEDEQPDDDDPPFQYFSPSSFVQPNNQAVSPVLQSATYGLPPITSISYADSDFTQFHSAQYIQLNLPTTTDAEIQELPITADVLEPEDLFLDDSSQSPNHSEHVSQALSTQYQQILETIRPDENEPSGQSQAQAVSADNEFLILSDSKEETCTQSRSAELENSIQEEDNGQVHALSSDPDTPSENESSSQTLSNTVELEKSVEEEESGDGEVYVRSLDPDQSKSQTSIQRQSSTEELKNSIQEEDTAHGTVNQKATSIESPSPPEETQDKEHEAVNHNTSNIQSLGSKEEEMETSVQDEGIGRDTLNENATNIQSEPCTEELEASIQDDTGKDKLNKKASSIQSLSSTEEELETSIQEEDTDQDAVTQNSTCVQSPTSEEELEMSMQDEDGEVTLKLNQNQNTTIPTLSSTEEERETSLDEDIDQDSVIQNEACIQMHASSEEELETPRLDEDGRDTSNPNETSIPSPASTAEEQEPSIQEEDIDHDAVIQNATGIQNVASAEEKQEHAMQDEDIVQKAVIQKQEASVRDEDVDFGSVNQNATRIQSLSDSEELKTLIQEDDIDQDTLNQNAGFQSLGSTNNLEASIKEEMDQRDHQSSDPGEMEFRWKRLPEIVVQMRKSSPETVHPVDKLSSQTVNLMNYAAPESVDPVGKIFVDSLKKSSTTEIVILVGDETALGSFHESTDMAVGLSLAQTDKLKTQTETSIPTKTIQSNPPLQTDSRSAEPTCIPSNMCQFPIQTAQPQASISNHPTEYDLKPYCTSEKIMKRKEGTQKLKKFKMFQKLMSQFQTKQSSENVKNVPDIEQTHSSDSSSLHNVPTSQGKVVKETIPSILEEILTKHNSAEEGTGKLKDIQPVRKTMDQVQIQPSKNVESVPVPDLQQAHGSKSSSSHHVSPIQSQAVKETLSYPIRRIVPKPNSPDEVAESAEAPQEVTLPPETAKVKKPIKRFLKEIGHEYKRSRIDEMTTSIETAESTIQPLEMTNSVHHNSPEFPPPAVTAPVQIQAVHPIFVPSLSAPPPPRKVTLKNVYNSSTRRKLVADLAAVAESLTPPVIDLETYDSNDSSLLGLRCLGRNSQGSSRSTRRGKQERDERQIDEMPKLIANHREAKLRITREELMPTLYPYFHEADSLN